MVSVAPFGSFLQIQSLAVRHEVLRKPLGLQFEPNDLENENSQVHIVFHKGERVFGVLLLMHYKDHTYKMRQVAVLPEAQNAGVGAQMVQFSEEHVKSLGGSRVELHARWNAIPFYEKLQYIAEGETFEEVGIPHKWMFKNLS